MAMQALTKLPCEIACGFVQADPTPMFSQFLQLEAVQNPAGLLPYRPPHAGWGGSPALGLELCSV